MKYLSIIILLIIIFFSASNVFSNEKSKNLNFVGFWQGIDYYDGSISQRSITLNIFEGTYKIIGRETSSPGCGGERAMFTGTGFLDKDSLVVNDFTLTCFNELDSVTVTVKYELDNINKILIEDYPGSAYEKNILHRIDRH